MPIKDPEKKRLSDERYRRENTAKHIDGVRWAKIWRKYGLTKEAWHLILDAQGGRCAICPRTEAGGRGQWHVDHDHKTGRVRGLLCCWCNRAIGMLGDDASRVQAAADYLREHSSPQEDLGA